MVFRKPYAFLIKNFKKIHILLLVLVGFIYFKTMQLDGFISDFLKYLSYDAYLEPITKYTSLTFYLIVLLVIIIFISLMVLLKRKEKPWKLYVIPVFEYIALLILFMVIQSYFANYEGGTSTTTARAFANFLLLLRIPQYITFIILLVRILGLDLNKFNFATDKEFLELDQDDREEFEVSVNFDKYSISRTIKKVKREVGYFYEEHRYIMNIFFVLLSVFIIGRTYYYFGVEHKTINEDEVLNANGYSIKINRSYFTNKDSSGNILEQNSNFVILNLTVKNNSSSRVFDAENFHIVNGNNDYSYSKDTYSNYFSDIGKTYPTAKMKNGEEKTFALIFKVSNTLPSDKFVLYYQQYKTYKTAYLRKIKLTLTDVSNIIEQAEKKLGEKLSVTYPNGKKQDFTLESANFVDSVSYTKEVCNSDFSCSISVKSASSTNGYKIIEIPFSSNYYEGEDLIDFSMNYGKIKYIDSEGMTKELKMENALKSKNYLGKILYLKVPIEIEKAQNIDFIYTIRNQKYTYKIR